MSLNPYRGERIGNLRERVELQEKTVEQNEFGEEIVTYETIETVWARVEPLKGQERFEAQQVTAKLSVRIYVRHRTDLSVQDRVVWDGKEFNILAMLNADERRRFLQLDCEAIQP